MFFSFRLVLALLKSDIDLFSSSWLGFSAPGDPLQSRFQHSDEHVSRRSAQKLHGTHENLVHKYLNPSTRRTSVVLAVVLSIFLDAQIAREGGRHPCVFAKSPLGTLIQMPN